MDARQFAHITQNWIQQVVIGHQLCPFAQQPVTKGQVRYRVSEARQEDQLWQELVEELVTLSESQPEDIETSLLIHPQVLGDFAAYLDFLEMVDPLLADMELEGVIQVASFHPDYQFADTEFDDPANYTNRSPYPMLHLIRESSIDEALATVPDPEQIPTRNVALMRKLGLATVQAEREEAFGNTDSPSDPA